MAEGIIVTYRGCTNIVEAGGYLRFRGLGPAPATQAEPWNINLSWTENHVIEDPEVEGGPRNIRVTYRVDEEGGGEDEDEEEELD